MGRMIRKKIKSYTVSAEKPYEKKRQPERDERIRFVALVPYFFIT